MALNASLFSTSLAAAADAACPSTSTREICGLGFIVSDLVTWAQSQAIHKYIYI